MAGKSATILFADITGSTRMFDTLGDVMAKQIVSETILCMEQEVERYHGHVIRTIGDEVMAELPGPEQGLLAAIAMQLSLAKHNANTGKNTQIRVGFNCGDVIHEDGDVFGDAINVASRIVDQCRPGQILTTQRTAAMMPAAVSDSMRSLGTRSLKGKEMDIEVFEILWQNDRSKLTVVSRSTPSITEEMSPSLCLEYQDNQMTIHDRDTPFVLGRDPESNLMVDDDRVSRIHAVIEYRQGQYNLSDRSTNGTWIYLGHHESLFIHQESLLLHSPGTISLGKDWKNFNTHNIDFRVEKIKIA
jgi:class 3 adenylate cyclase